MLKEFIFLFKDHNYIDNISEYIGRNCSNLGRYEKFQENFSWKTCRKEQFETQVLMRPQRNINGRIWTRFPFLPSSRFKKSKLKKKGKILSVINKKKMYLKSCGLSEYSKAISRSSSKRFKYIFVSKFSDPPHKKGILAVTMRAV